MVRGKRDDDCPPAKCDSDVGAVEFRAEVTLRIWQWRDFVQAAGNGILQLDKIFFDVLMVSSAGLCARGIREQFAAGPIDLLACHFHVLNCRAGEIFSDVTEYMLRCIDQLAMMLLEFLA